VIVSKRSGLIVAGHGRVEAAIRLGVESVPVNHQDFATEEDELAFLIADNRIPELAEMDDAALARLIEDDLRGKIDLELAGIIEEIGKAELKVVKEQPAPAMAWVLIGIPTVRFGESTRPWNGSPASRGRSLKPPSPTHERDLPENRQPQSRGEASAASAFPDQVSLTHSAQGAGLLPGIRTVVAQAGERVPPG
jgi:hypothetical protein